MNKTIAFWDLDDTLWKLRNEIWMIDKEKSWKALFLIDPIEFALINNGHFRKDNQKISYNGKTFYISQKMFDKASKKAKTENIERFGISFTNFTDKDLLNGSDMEILIDNIFHLRDDKFIDIGLLTARSNQRNHSDILNKLRLKLKDIDILIKKIYFVADIFSPKTTDKLSIKKLYVLLEHLIGFKIKDGAFIEEKQDWYQTVHFYDDNVKNIDYANYAQDTLEGLMKKTDDMTYKLIMNRMEEYELKLCNYLVSGNQMNRFKKTEVILHAPFRYPIRLEESITRNFNDFLND